MTTRTCFICKYRVPKSQNLINDLYWCSNPKAKHFCHVFTGGHPVCAKLEVKK